MRVYALISAIAVGVLVFCAHPAQAFLFKKKSDTKLVVPKCETAQEQYAYASKYQTTQVLYKEGKKRDEQLDKIVQCYEAVCTNFPTDVKYTPLAYLEIADAVNVKGDNKQAIKMYEAAIEKYSDNEYLVARALTTIGKTYDTIGKYEKAKEVYKQVIDRFSESQNSGVRDMVKRSHLYYYTLKEPAADKKRKKAKEDNDS